jgi:prepilin-type N-terminal cleavage/methylation domain-containing protein
MRREATMRSTPKAAPGFTLIEMIVVMFIIVLLAAFGFPALQQMFARSKLQGSAREIAVHLGSSRVTAMRMSRNVVVKPLFSEKKLVSFVDDNANFIQDLGEQVVSTLPLPGIGGSTNIHMMGPDGVDATDDDPAEALEGLTTVDDGDPDTPDTRVAVFVPDGSIRDQGGFRISDGKSPANMFEVRIDPPATARVEILKYVYGDTRGLNQEATSPAGSWFGQGGNNWEWY